MLRRGELTPPRARPLRVLYVQAAAGGGSATGLSDLLRVVDRERFEPVVLVYSDGRQVEDFRAVGASVMVLGEEAERGAAAARQALTLTARTWRRSRLLRTDLPLARRLVRLVREHRIDLVHHNNNPARNRASMLAARWANLPQVAHVRFMHPYEWTDRLAASVVDRFLFVSNAVRAHCRDWIGSAAKRGIVFFDPFDFSKADAAMRSSVPVRAQLGFGAEDRIIVNVGRIVPWKGQDVFVHAMADVVRAHPDARGVIVGEPGPGTVSQTYAARLRQLVQELGLRDHIHFTGYRADVPRIMTAADIVVHSATKPEPFGRVIVEGMAARRPVIATADGGVLDIIDDGDTGLLVGRGDPLGMARAIGSLLDDPAGARSMGERGRRSAELRFSFQRAGAALRDVYETLVAVRPTRAIRRTAGAY